MTEIEKMISLVSQEDLSNIILQYTDENCCTGINMKEHISEWASRKEHIFKLFGNKLKIEKEVDTDLPYTLVQEKLETFFEKILVETKFNLIKVFLRALRADEVSKNILESDFKMFDTTFKGGMKVSKCFKQLVKKEFLYEVTTKYSMFIQSLKAKGVAVLSIDPIDYLTMSANKSGWRSCHAPDGEYRVGQIAYMMDGSSIISYVKSNEDCVLDSGTTHTNKIWRQIVLINEKNSYALQARQYPAENDANSNTVGEMLKGAIENWTSESYSIHSASPCNNYFCGLQDDTYSDNILFYNDISNKAFETGSMIIPVEFEKKEFINKASLSKFPKIIVGSSVPCLCGCGDNLSNAEYYFSENDCYQEGRYDYDED